MGVMAPHACGTPTMVESIPRAFLPVGPMAAALEEEVVASVEEQVVAWVVGVAVVAQAVTSNWTSELRDVF